MNKKELRTAFAQARRDVKATRLSIRQRLFESAHLPAIAERPPGWISIHACHVMMDTIKEHDKRAQRLVRNVNQWDELTFSKEHIENVRNSMMPVVKLFSGYQHSPDTNQILPLLFNGVVTKLTEPLTRGLEWGTRSEELDEVVAECRGRLYGTAQAYAEYEFRRRTGYTRELSVVS
jgi:hypothetical protein